MKIKIIDQSEFEKIDSPRRIIAHNYAHKFAAIDLGAKLGCYGISWRSELIEPIIKLSQNSSEMWIGVDEKLAAINLHDGRIIVALPFTTYIVQILSLDSATAILTQEEVLVFNPEGAIRFSEALPDQGTRMSVIGEHLIIKMLEGDSFTINLMTGHLQQALSDRTYPIPESQSAIATP
ncbi:hypothetical protein PN499_02250 [Kamptonema animale CS-326]|jgi:hypothetical protein|uniref:hypothetical protein n=1 Tax=Kamptonema animale TaxID=92934 RepID=UPI002330CE0C|nr:hypothetical protein [Kamptonema animale]MDB9510029.1 hypothetical protein [Kamptonema animale CS-326]